MRLLIFLLSLFLGVFSVLNSSIEIGVLLPLTGFASNIGIEAKQAIEMFSLENQQSSPSLHFQLVNDQSTVNGSIEGMQLLVKEKVTAIISGFLSNLSAASTPLAQVEHIPFLISSSTDDKLTLGKEYIFRTTYTNSAQGTVLASFALNTLKAKTAAIFHDESSLYSKSLALSFKEHFTQSGGLIIGEFSYRNDTPSYLNQLGQVKRLDPQVLFLPGFAQYVGTILLEAKALNITSTFLGSDGWGNSTLMSLLANGAQEGTYFATPFYPKNPAPQTQEFVSRYRQSYGGSPTHVTALCYDSCQILKKALTLAGSTNPDAIVSAIEDIKDFEGVTGQISFKKESGDPIRSLYILQITKNGYKLIETLNNVP